MAEPTDITFKICNVRVNCRAVAIILNEGNILFQKRKQILYGHYPEKK